MATDANGRWIGLGVGDVDDPATPRTAPNWNAITLLTTKLHDKYQWARDIGVVASSTYNLSTAAAVQQFCQRTGLPVILDPNGYAVANLAMRTRLGSYPPPPPILPLFFTVEGHSSNMFSGPVADTAAQLESEGLCRHQPIGYNDNTIPFDNASGVNELARLVGATTMDNGVPFPAGTKWMLGTFSQGGIVGYDFHEQFLAPGRPLEWREEDRLGTLAYGDPCRAGNSIAPWAVGQITKQNTHGLDPRKRYGLPGCPAVPPNFMDDYREGDIFAENDDSLAGQMRAAIYQAVARGVVFTGQYSLLAEIAETFRQPVQSAIAIFEAIISGVVFLADSPNPHYSPYDITGGLNWARERLR